MKPNRHIGIQLGAIFIGGLLLTALSWLAIFVDYRLGLLGVPIAGAALVVVAWSEHRHEPPTLPPPTRRQRHAPDREFWRIAHQALNAPYSPRHIDRNRQGGDR